MIDKQIKVIDIFAGAGGFSLGFSLAGYKVTFSLEIDEWAAETLQYNNSEMKVVREDIRNYKSLSDIYNLCTELPDVIIGGPPCQGFSIAGPAQNGMKDPRNSLFLEFAKWVECLNPKVFIMENVKGILSRKNSDGERVIDIIKKTFDNLGYTIEVWILNAAEYGIPQIRERVFIVGNNIGIEKICHPEKTHYISNQNGNYKKASIIDIKHSLIPAVSLYNAISDLPELKAGDGEEEQTYTTEPRTEFQLWARSNQEILFNHVAMKHTKRLIDRFKHIGWGQSVLNVPNEHKARKRNGNGQLSETVYHSNNRRLDPNLPSCTIPASFYSSFIHPYQDRNLTAREAARIQSFPDWYRFMGKRTVVSRKLLERNGCDKDNHLSQYNQIGNAVPPLLAKAIAEHIKKILIT